MKKQMLALIIIITFIAAGSLFFMFQEKNKKRESSFLNACEAVEGATFHSVEMLDIGLGPEGDIIGYWVISFTNGNFSWDWSDISESGIYESDGWNITGYQDNRKYEHHGTFVKETDTLLWEGVEYIRVK